MSAQYLELKSYLAGIKRGPIADLPHLQDLLVDCWEDFEGAKSNRMAAFKLSRIERAEWEPPVLTLYIERHGGTVLGSTRAEIEAWEIDINARTAEANRTSYRQIEPRAKGKSVKEVAQELVQSILSGNQAPQLKWKSTTSVQVLASLVFPTPSGPRRTVGGRRSRLYGAVEEILRNEGWVYETRGLFVKKVDSPQSAG